jgi:hypothetical protein
MLTKIREKSQGAFAGVILTVICVPFFLWGINNYINDGQEAPVASVGKKDFYQRDVTKAYEKYQQSLGGLAADDQSIKLQALRKLIKDEETGQENWKQDKFNVANIEFRKELFLKQPVYNLMGAVAFFLNGNETFTSNMKDFIQEAEK